MAALDAMISVSSRPASRARCEARVGNTMEQGKQRET